MSYYTRFTGRLALSRQLTLDEYRDLEDNWVDGVKLQIKGCGLYGETWSPWSINKEGTELSIECDGSAYYWEEVLQLMVDQFFSPKGIILNGEMTWNGEEGGDLGRLIVKDNVIRTVSLDDITGMKKELINLGASMANYLINKGTVPTEIAQLAADFLVKQKDLVEL